MMIHQFDHGDCPKENEKINLGRLSPNSMNLELTEEQDMIIGMVRKFVREEILPPELDLDPDADELERDDRERLIEKTKAMGLYGLDIPPEYGGPEIDLVTRTPNGC